MLLKSSCLTGGCVYIFMSWDSENVPDLIVCLWAETKFRNGCFCLTCEANFEILHHLSIAYPIFDAQWHDRVLPTRAALTRLLRTPFAWVLVTLCVRQSVGLLVGQLGSLLFGFGFPWIYCKNCASDFGFSACFGMLTFFVVGTSSWVKTSVVLLPKLI